MAEQVVLITGASTGFGRLVAEALPARGHRPIATMREVGGRNAPHARALRALGIDVVEIDVTSDASVASGVEAALELGGRIDVLVNNAGFGFSGPLEAATTEEVKEVFETNEFGVHRMVRAVVPHMRERGSGLLVHLSSGAGRIAIPGAGVYCASKWAVEAMGEALRYELAPFGIDSVVVEPGRYDTDFHTRSMRRARDEARLAPYGFLFEGMRRRFERLPAGDPSEVVEAIVRLIEMPHGTRPTRLPVQPGGARWLDRLNELQAEVQRGVVEMYGQDAMLRSGT